MNPEEVPRRRVRGFERVVERAARIDVVTLKRLVVLGMSLRVVLLFVTSGSNDILSWERIGRHIAAWGVLDEYQRTVQFNHPPLMGLWGRTAVWIADHTPVPYHVRLLRSPPTDSGCGSSTRSRSGTGASSMRGGRRPCSR